MYTSLSQALNQLFSAANQTSYLLYASDNNQNFKITRLDADYYNVTTQVNVLTGECFVIAMRLSQTRSLLGATLEAPGIVKRNSVNSI